MSHENRRRTLVSLVLCSIGYVGPANAQGRFDCRSPVRPSIGVSAGLSSSLLEPASALSREEPNSSVSVRDGAQLAGRADLPVAGPVRLRLEAARSQWGVRRTVYDPAAGYQVVSESSIGSLSDRHLVGLIGVNITKNVPCAYVAAGGGFYSIGFRGASFRSPAVAFAAGMEFPTGARGVIQIDTALHVVNSRDGRAITSSSEILTLKLLAGWAYRF